MVFCPRCGSNLVFPDFDYYDCVMCGELFAKRVADAVSKKKNAWDEFSLTQNETPRQKPQVGFQHFDRDRVYDVRPRLQLPNE